MLEDSPWKVVNWQGSLTRNAGTLGVVLGCGISLTCLTMSLFSGAIFLYSKSRTNRDFCVSVLYRFAAEIRSHYLTVFGHTKRVLVWGL